MMRYGGRIGGGEDLWVRCGCGRGGSTGGSEFRFRIRRVENNVVKKERPSEIPHERQGLGPRVDLVLSSYTLVSAAQCERRGQRDGPCI